MKKAIILIFAMVLMAISVEAYINLPQTSFNISQSAINKSALYFFDDFNDNGTGMYNTTNWPTTDGNGGSTTANFKIYKSGTNGILNISSDGASTWAGIHNAYESTANGLCIDMRVIRLNALVQVEADFDSGQGRFFAGANTSGRCIESGGDPTGMGNDVIGLWSGGSGQRRPTPAKMSTTDFTNITIAVNADGTSQLWINNSAVNNISDSSTTITTGTQYLFVRGQTQYGVDYFYVYNCTKGFPTQPATDDAIPPNIIYYNLTTDNGCESWNTNKNTACNTTSVTPTIQFNTDENAWCGISGNSSSTSGMNYSDMGASRQCSGPSGGDGTSSHMCTIISQDELVSDISYIYISCKDSNGNQNLTSTSGPLKINVTVLESYGRNSIDAGISNALVSSYTTYTDQKIYARNSANNQSVGKFDKVAKKSSKLWAFNYVSNSESPVNMFNITPVFYNFEFINKTSDYIKNQTALLINATK